MPVAFWALELLTRIARLEVRLGARHIGHVQGRRDVVHGFETRKLMTAGQFVAGRHG